MRRCAVGGTAVDQEAARLLPDETLAALGLAQSGGTLRRVPAAVRRAKERHSFVSSPCGESAAAAAAAAAAQPRLELDDGTLLALGPDAARLSAEVLFSRAPELPGCDPGDAPQTVPEAVCQALAALGALGGDAMAARWRVLVVGGGALMPGFPGRLEAELADMLGADAVSAEGAVRVTRGGSGDACWAGASALAAEGRWADIWVTRAEYDQRGSDVVLEKCCF